MKKATLVIVLAITANASYGNITVQKCNGSILGFGAVGEYHSVDGNTHILTCWNPGLNRCRWKSPPSALNMDDVESMVYEYIRAGILEGSFYAEEGNEVRFSYEKETDYLIYEIAE